MSEIAFENRPTLRSYIRGTIHIHCAILRKDIPWIELLIRQLLWLLFCWVLQKTLAKDNHIIPKTSYILINTYFLCFCFYYMTKPLRLYHRLNAHYQQQLLLTDIDPFYIIFTRFALNLVTFLISNFISLTILAQLAEIDLLTIIHIICIVVFLLSCLDGLEIAAFFINYREVRIVSNLLTFSFFAISGLITLCFMTSFTYCTAVLLSLGGIGLSLQPRYLKEIAYRVYY